MQSLQPDPLCCTSRVGHGRGLDFRYAYFADNALVSSVCLPSVVEELLVEVITDGFAVYCCGDRAAPSALVAAYEWDHYIDLITICSFDRVTTARVPRWGTIDLFAPDVVVWAYEGPPQQALRALLDLVHPQHPDAPTTGYPAPPSLRIPRAEQRPMTIRLPSPGRVGARAARLTTAMSAHGDRVVKGRQTRQ